MQTLSDTLAGMVKNNLHENEVNAVILSNLRKGFGQRPYQLEAFSRFVSYVENINPEMKSIQLLFHMATGSGKTLVMAGCMLYLYRKGYRNFIFFVNSTNIIGKTRDNFLNPHSSKYLFGESILIGEKRIQIREVDNFQAANPNDINIVFSTIQGLHTRLNTPKENAITYNDFEEKNIVLISDEAHHINAETKKGERLSREVSEEVVSWEGTVNRIFRANEKNILLEFTATADLTDPETGIKYRDKLLFDYPLKQFRADGYSKEVKVLQADLPMIERAIQAVILSQYRRKVFEKNKILIKPVILFKSRSIKESQVFYHEFVDAIRNLKPALILKTRKNANASLQEAFAFLDANQVTVGNLIIELKNDFAEEKCISVNSKEESESKQIAVNTLEDASNEYRAVFAVDKLNEGWDVLNLFDIVRLYDTRDASKGKPGKTTMSEAQLIGRGARYCPFVLADGHSPYLRKFDENIDHEIRICEELYYHSAYNPRYIEELNTALVEIGIKEKVTIEIELKLKDEFKKTSFYKSGLVYLNKQSKVENSGIRSLPISVIETPFRVSLKTGTSVSSDAFSRFQRSGLRKKEQEFQLNSFGIPVIRKALGKLEFYQFSNLRNYLPNLRSIIEFITSDSYLGMVKVEVEGTAAQLSQLSQEEKLEIVIRVLKNISEKIVSEKMAFIGSPDFKPLLIRDKLKDKKLSIGFEVDGDRELGAAQSSSSIEDIKLDLSCKDWFVFNDHRGSSTENLFYKAFDTVYEKLKADFSEVYLIRNEKYFTFYNFQDGKPLNPDFLMFFTKQKGRVKHHYQILIDIKSGRGSAKAKDDCESSFLNHLNKEYEVKQNAERRIYFVLGISLVMDKSWNENPVKSIENVLKRVLF